MASYNTYTAEQEAFLRNNHFGRTRKELTDLFNKEFGTNKTVLAIKSWCNNRGFQCGNDGKFAKGNIPWQTGLSTEEYKSHFTEESFKKSILGIKEIRKYCIGDTVIRHNEPYVVISVEPNTPWDKRIQPKRRYVYEQSYGPIPDNYHIIQLDGDKFNCDLDNLYCAPNTYTGLINKNHWRSKNKDITLSAIKWCELFYALKDMGGSNK
jgi:hypothetical protein